MVSKEIIQQIRRNLCEAIMHIPDDNVEGIEPVRMSVELIDHLQYQEAAKGMEQMDFRKAEPKCDWCKGTGTRWMGVNGKGEKVYVRCQCQEQTKPPVGEFANLKKYRHIPLLVALEDGNGKYVLEDMDGIAVALVGPQQDVAEELVARINDYPKACDRLDAQQLLLEKSQSDLRILQAENADLRRRIAEVDRILNGPHPERPERSSREDQLEALCRQLAEVCSNAESLIAGERIKNDSFPPDCDMGKALALLFAASEIELQAALGAAKKAKVIDE